MEFQLNHYIFFSSLYPDDGLVAQWWSVTSQLEGPGFDSAYAPNLTLFPDGFLITIYQIFILSFIHSSYLLLYYYLFHLTFTSFSFLFFFSFVCNSYFLSIVFFSPFHHNHRYISSNFQDIFSSFSSFLNHNLLLLPSASSSLS